MRDELYVDGEEVFDDEAEIEPDDRCGRDSRDPDDPIFDYDDDDLVGSRFDPDCEDDPM